MTEHAVVTCGNESSNTRFLAYLLSTMQLGRLSGQSAQPGLSVKTIGQQVIKLPPLKVQNIIADMLTALDEKIEVNESINKNLAA
jgi:type I restriction enzyme S subunit